MKKCNLVCSADNQIVRDLLRINGFDLDPGSMYVICEDGMEFGGDYDVLIRFKKDTAAKLMDFLSTNPKYEPHGIMGEREGSYAILELGSICYFHAFGNDTFANTVDGRQYKIKFKLYELEETLLPRSFIRINKSEIVNIKHVLSIIPMFKGKLILKVQGCKEGFDVSRNYLKDFKERIGM